MKAISLTQPWATLVAIEAKRIETRSWSTSYRGPIAIHAAKGLGSVGGKRGLQEQCGIEPFAAVLTLALKSHMSAHWKGNDFLKKHYEHPFMPLGAIVATANIVKCLPTDGGSFLIPSDDSNEFAFGDYSPNRYMWFFENVKRMRQPIECKGALSIWTVPSEVERLVIEQTK